MNNVFKHIYIFKLMTRLTYSLIEVNKNKSNVTYDNILKSVNENEKLNNNFSFDQNNYNDNYAVLACDYDENYTKKQLEKIMDYYKLDKRKKRKNECIESIILFELDDVNEEIVNRRKLMWFYIEEIKNDNYLSKFLILE